MISCAPSLPWEEHVQVCPLVKWRCKVQGKVPDQVSAYFSWPLTNPYMYERNKCLLLYVTKTSWIFCFTAVVDWHRLHYPGHSWLIQEWAADPYPETYEVAWGNCSDAEVPHWMMIDQQIESLFLGNSTMRQPERIIRGKEVWPKTERNMKAES